MQYSGTHRYIEVWDGDELGRVRFTQTQKHASVCSYAHRRTQTHRHTDTHTPEPYDVLGRAIPA